MFYLLLCHLFLTVTVRLLFHPLALLLCRIIQEEKKKKKSSVNEHITHFVYIMAKILKQPTEQDPGRMVYSNNSGVAVQVTLSTRAR